VALHPCRGLGGRYFTSGGVFHPLSRLAERRNAVLRRLVHYRYAKPVGATNTPGIFGWSGAFSGR
jgi:hypothetical protein